MKGLLFAGAVGALVVGYVGWSAYRGWASRIEDLQSDISAGETMCEWLEGELRRAGDVRERARAFAATTLAQDEETGDAKLRERVNRLIAESGVSDGVIETRRARAVDSPVIEEGTYELSRRTVRGMNASELDFAELRASVRAEGSLESCLRLSARLDAQPWVHRVTMFSLAPKNGAPGVFDLAVDLTTLLAPGLPGDRAPEEYATPSSARLASLDSILEKNVFVRREPVVVAAAPDPPPNQDPEPAPVKPPPPPPPWHEWTVTGVIEASGGIELWLLNTRSNERRVLREGQGVLTCLFEGVEGEWARLRIEGAVYHVRAGQSLAERKPVDAS